MAFDNFWDAGPSYDYSTVDTSTGDAGGYDQVGGTGGSFTEGDWSGSNYDTSPTLSGQNLGYGSSSNADIGNFWLNKAISGQDQGSNNFQNTDYAQGAYTQDGNLAFPQSSVSAQALTPYESGGITPKYKQEGEGFIDKLLSGAKDLGSAVTSSTPGQRVQNDPFSAALKAAASMYGYNQAKRNQQALRPILQQQQQFGNQLQQTYTNPQQYLASPEAQAYRSQLSQQVLRRDAASGRRSQYGARANELNNAMMNNLGKYRQGLAGLYQPQVQGQMASAIQGQAPARQLISGLGSIFGPQQPDNNQLAALALAQLLKGNQ